jgi:hypothetical protein
MLNSRVPLSSMVRTHLDAVTATKVRLKVGTTKGITIWLDGEPVEVAATMTLDLTPGTHTLTVGVDHTERKEDVRLEVEDTPAAAGVRFVGGK